MFPPSCDLPRRLSCVAAVGLLAVLTGCGGSAPSPGSTASGTASTSGPATASTATSGAPLTVTAVNGSGCPRGIAQHSVDVSTGDLTLTYTPMTAKGANARMFCQVSLNVTGRPSQQFAIVKTTHHGTSALAAGETADVAAKAYVSGQSATATVKSSLSGPHSGAHTVVLGFADADVAWSPCGKDALYNYATSITLTRGGNVTLTSSTLPLTWRPCTP